MSLVSFPRQMSVDPDGLPRVAAEWAFYEAGTSTLLTLYTTPAMGPTHPNPVPSVEGGYFPAVYINASQHPTHKQVLFDADGLVIFTEDNIQTEGSTLRQELEDGDPGLVDAQAISHRRTAAEISEDVTPTDFHVVPGNDYRYGTTGDGVTDDTVALQTALDTFAAVDNYSYSVTLPDGFRSVSNITVNNRNCIRGSSLEATRLEAKAGTIGVWVNDNGNAAKIEIYNLTLDGNSEAGITHGLQLGVDNIQFGTYGTLDNIMVRDMPSATAYHIDGNALALGKLYSLNTLNGYISHSNGSGTHIETMTPYEFTGIGVQLAKADSVNFVEAEAPAADTAKPLVYERGGFVLNYYLSIGPARTVRTPVQINVTHVGHWALGPTVVNFSNPSTSRYGDTTDPNESGTASSGAASSLTDTTKTWTRDQWMDAALHITGGTGSGQWKRVTGNSKDTLSVIGAWDTNPDATSTYEMSYFIRKATDAGLQTAVGDGFGHSDSFTAYWPWFQRLSVGDQIATDKLLVGKSNDSVAITGIMKVAATVNFASVNANAVGTHVDVTVRGAQVGMPVVLGLPDALASLGILVTPCVQAANTVRLYPKNLTGSPIDPPSATVVITVLDYA